eukprot:Clim_evm49s142 gene=Clim_evmTU49s142
MTTAPIDCDTLKQIVAADVSGSMVATAVGYIGDEMGLFMGLAKLEDTKKRYVTPVELAEALNLRERYVREWCRAAAGAGYISKRPREDDSTDEVGAFGVGEGQREVLCTPGGPHDLTGYFGFQLCLTNPKVAEGIKKCFDLSSDMVGLPFSSFGAGLTGYMTRMHIPAFEYMLVPKWIAPCMPDLHRMLLAPTNGHKSRILDVGCGCGHSTRSLSHCYPDAEVVGLDPDEESCEQARNDSKNSPNVSFVQATVQDWPKQEPKLDQGYDLILAHDCVHDMADPVGGLRAMGELLAGGNPHARILWSEPGGSQDPSQMTSAKSRGRVAISVLHCMTVSLAQPGGTETGGVGTIIGKAGCQEMARKAGLTFEELPASDFNQFVFALGRPSH